MTVTLYALTQRATKAKATAVAADNALRAKCKHPFIAQERYRSSGLMGYGGSYSPPWRMCLVCGLREQRDGCGKPLRLWGRRPVMHVDNAFREVLNASVIRSLKQIARGVRANDTEFIANHTEVDF